MGVFPTGHQRYDEEAVAPRSRFSAIEVISGRLRRLFSSRPLPQDEGRRYVPTTTTERRRASTTGQSLDEDEKLPENVSEQNGNVEDEKLGAEKTVLYLAYGSNLASETFLGRRNIKPVSQANVLVPELKLTFDLPGLPYYEPCFAGSRFRHVPDVKAEGTTSGDETGMIENSSEKSRLVTEQEYYRKDRWHKPLIGVVYEVTLSDYARIIATEGGGQSYRDIVVTCYPFPKAYDPADPVPDYPDTKPFKAHTLHSPAAVEEVVTHKALTASSGCREQERELPKLSGRLVRPDPSYAQPSARYLNLLSTGAAEHNLPLSYRAYLSDIRPYRITTPGQRVGKAIFLVLWGPLVLTIITLSSVLAGPDGRSPAWLIKASNIVFKAMWDSYDGLFRRVFGDGERTVGDT